MAARVKPKRQYNSPRRQEQAAATRRSILEAAQRLFERDGYPATTMEMVATEAGVALKTVYVVFTTKSGLLRGLWDFLLKGDQQDAGVAERSWYREVLDEPDPQRQLRLNARERARREGTHRRAATGDTRRRTRRRRPRDPVGPHPGGLLREPARDHRDPVQEARAQARSRRHTRATDILWTLNHPDLWLLLVDTRGWTPDEFEKWFADTACAQLLKPAPRAKR